VDLLLRGEPLPSQQLNLPPAGVVMRQSTDVIATEDALVARALHLIRDGATAGLTAEALARQVPLSRSGFERQFRAAVGRSPMQEIQRVRVEAVKARLLETSHTLDVIAAQGGFPSVKQMHAIFKRFTGMTPDAFRRRER
jgi:LacI family transcriptional regulator